MKFFYRHRVILGSAALALAILCTFAVCFFALSRTAAQAQRLTVVLDAGHGGVDGGVVGMESGVKESDINLEITYLLREKFEEAGFNVVLTRKTEAGLYGLATPGYKRRDMQKRADVIRSAAPALVISVHQNFFSQRSRRGAQVFFREGNARSAALAGSVQAALNAMPECVKQTSALRGDYYILNCSDFASVIVECGFLSNVEDEKLLLDGTYRKKLVSAIASGAMSFLASAG